jgi:hypothetical protein
MFRTLFAAFLALSVLIPAAASAAQSSSLAGVRCEDPPVLEYIRDSMKGMTFSVSGNTRPVSSLFDNYKVTSAKTVRATADTLVCSLRVQFTYSGQPHSQRGRYTLKNLPDGTARVSFDPNY